MRTRFPCVGADERGVALITAVLASMVMVLLATVTVGVAAHNLSRSAINRERVQSIAAAEAGLNYVFSHLQTASEASLQCNISQSLATAPTSGFTTALYVDDGFGSFEALACPPFAMPSQLLVRSTGTAVGPHPQRTMESLVDVVPIPGGIFGNEAIFSDGSLVFDSNIEIRGDTANDADVYSNGSITISSNVVISGDAIAQGTIVVNSNAEVKGTVYAAGDVVIKRNSVVRGDVVSSGGAVTLENNSHVYGDVKAAGAITLNGTAKIDGLTIANTPSAPPPPKALPSFGFVESQWTAPGYTVLYASDCTTAKALINAIVSGDTVVRVTSSCELKWGGNTQVIVKGNLAIIHNGPIVLDNNMDFLSDGNLHDLLLIGGLNAASCNVEARSNSSIGPNLRTLIYSPCLVKLSSNTFIVEGQIFGGQVSFTSNTTMTYSVVGGPGSVAAGYGVEPRFIREVRAAS